MKHWCYYSRVVAYLEKVEALFPDETRKGAYLLWRDEDGSPLMIAGPGVDWFKGRGPMPDLNNLGHAVESPVRAQNASDGSPAANREHHHPKQQSRGRKPAVKPPTHRPSATSKATPTPPPATAQARNSTKQANKKRTHFVKAAQIRSNPAKEKHTPVPLPDNPKSTVLSCKTMPPPAPQDPLAAIKLRPMTDADLPFLLRVYASTRAEELAMTTWDDSEKESFVKMQFEAQHGYYQKQFPHAGYQIIEKDGGPIARLYLDRRPQELRIIDIALLPEQRGTGIGGALMQRVLDEAALLGKPVRIHVEKNNPAMHLYDRLGFRQTEDQGVYWLMEWTVQSPAGQSPERK